METAAFCFAVDLTGDAPGAVLDDMAALGFDGAVLAAAYHEARDFLPHHARHRVHYSPAGVCFQADPSLYPPELRPHPLLPVCAGRDVLAQTVAAATERRMFVDAWVVYLHRDDRPAQVSSGRGFVENAFGDLSPVALCPAAPSTQRYAVALTRDVCRRRPRAIVAEALHYLPFEHDFHHERLFCPLDELQRTLLCLCFCQSCRQAAHAAGVDAEPLAAWVRGVVDGDIATDCEPAWDRARVSALGDSAGRALGAYLDLRELHVSTLAGQCAGVAADAGVEFRFLDLSAALVDGYPAADGQPHGVDIAWSLGVNLSTVERSCRVMVAPYVREPARMASEIAAYTEMLRNPLAGVVIRPAGPDCPDTDNLIDKVRELREQAIPHVAYYHYGLVTGEILARIGAAHQRSARG